MILYNMRYIFSRRLMAFGIAIFLLTACGNGKREEAAAGGPAAAGAAAELDTCALVTAAGTALAGGAESSLVMAADSSLWRAAETP